MKKVLGYAAALVAALSLAGVAATSAHADGASADAASGISSSSSSDTYNASFSFDGGGDAAVPTADSSSAVSASSSSAASSSSSAESSKPEKPAKKPAKVVKSSKKMRGRLRYRKDSRTVLFQKGRKGAKVTLRNRKGQYVTKFTVKRDGKFSIKLSKKEAEKLAKYGKYFTFTVAEKGYKTYTVKYVIFK
ncbi:hypothetical protein [Levilactobacillus zymae]|uniref:hypothetical protein n=1 Tax=Levilactobacillus zymae TaxID=267363 RepID=UPI0012FA2E9D|nr:hypothetical protein [Levilactobacillus zymae]